MAILQDKGVIFNFPASDCDFDLLKCPDSTVPGFSAQEFEDRKRALRELIFLIFRFGPDVHPGTTSINLKTSGMYYLYTEVFRHFISTDLLTTGINTGEYVPKNAFGTIFSVNPFDNSLVLTNDMRDAVSTIDIAHLDQFLPELKPPSAYASTLATIRPTLLCEAATIFAYYYLNFVMSNYSGVTIKLGNDPLEETSNFFKYAISGPTINENINIGHAYYKKNNNFNINQIDDKLHPIIKCLKARLVQNGLKIEKIGNNLDTEWVYETFNPTRPAGYTFYRTTKADFPNFKDLPTNVGNWDVTNFHINDGRNNRIEMFIRVLKKGRFDTLTPSPSQQIFRIGAKESPAVATSSYVTKTLLGSNTSRQTTFAGVLAMYAKAQQISESYIEAFENYIQHLIRCFYKQIESPLSPPRSGVLASGDGSPTQGILNIANAAIGLFSYQYTSDNVCRISDTNTRTFPVDTDQEVIHFTSLGFDFDNEYSFFYIKEPNGNLYQFKGRKKLGETVFTPENSTNVLVVSSGEMFYFYPKWPATTGRPLLATYNRSTRDFVFAKDGIKIIEIKLQSAFKVNPDPDVDKKESGLARELYEELLVMYNIVPLPISNKITLSFSDLYSNDKFEVKCEKIDRILNGFIERSFIDKLIDLLITNPTAVIDITLDGNFVGITQDELPDTPVVKSDVNFIPHGSTVSPENDPPSDVDYSKLRYSFGKAEFIDDTHVSISISSWVSPRVSNLDLKITNVDYRNGSIIPSGFPSAFPITGGTAVDTLNDLKTKFVFTPYFIPAFSKNSYNQPLAMLRSFGLLEAFFIKLIYVAVERGKSITEINSLKATLGDILNKPTTICTDKTRDSRGFAATSPDYQKSTAMTYSDFKNYKWYRLESVQHDEFNNVKKDTAGNDIPIAGFYEYDEYEHQYTSGW